MWCAYCVGGGLRLLPEVTGMSEAVCVCVCAGRREEEEEEMSHMPPRFSARSDVPTNPSLPFTSLAPFSRQRLYALSSSSVIPPIVAVLISTDQASEATPSRLCASSNTTTDPGHRTYPVNVRVGHVRVNRSNHPTPGPALPAVPGTACGSRRPAGSCRALAPSPPAGSAAASGNRGRSVGGGKWGRDVSC